MAKQPNDYRPASLRRKPGGYPCPECGFKAKHAMGLGRHRSAIHGVTPKNLRNVQAGAPGEDPRFGEFLDGLERLITEARRALKDSGS